MLIKIPEATPDTQTVTLTSVTELQKRPDNLLSETVGSLHLTGIPEGILEHLLESKVEGSLIALV